MLLFCLSSTVTSLRLYKWLLVPSSFSLYSSLPSYSSPLSLCPSFPHSPLPSMCSWQAFITLLFYYSSFIKPLHVELFWLGVVCPDLNRDLNPTTGYPYVEFDLPVTTWPGTQLTYCPPTASNSSLQPVLGPLGQVQSLSMDCSGLWSHELPRCLGEEGWRQPPSASVPSAPSATILVVPASLLPTPGLHSVVSVTWHGPRTCTGLWWGGIQMTASTAAVAACTTQIAPPHLLDLYCAIQQLPHAGCCGTQDLYHVNYCADGTHTDFCVSRCPAWFTTWFQLLPRGSFRQAFTNHMISLFLLSECCYNSCPNTGRLVGLFLQLARRTPVSQIEPGQPLWDKGTSS